MTYSTIIKNLNVNISTLVITISELRGIFNNIYFEKTYFRYSQVSYNAFRIIY